MTTQQLIEISVAATRIVLTVVGIIVAVFAIMVWDRLCEVQRKTSLTYMVISQIEEEYWGIKNKHHDCVGCKHIYYDSGGGVHCDIEPKDKDCMNNYRSNWEPDNFAR